MRPTQYLHTVPWFWRWATAFIRTLTGPDVEGTVCQTPRVCRLPHRVAVVPRGRTMKFVLKHEGVL
jgi:hypothetical protein